MYCYNCGKEVSGVFCASCGAKQDVAGDAQASQQGYNPNQQQGYNPNQQQGYNPNQQYNQGYNPNQQYQGTQQKSKLAAGLLQIFLAGFAVGRFYLGYTGIAVAQLLVSIFTLGIGAIWPFIDGIMILTGSVPCDASGVPLRD